MLTMSGNRGLLFTSTPVVCRPARQIKACCCCNAVTVSHWGVVDTRMHHFSSLFWGAHAIVLQLLMKYELPTSSMGIHMQGSWKALATASHPMSCRAARCVSEASPIQVDCKQSLVRSSLKRPNRISQNWLPLESTLHNKIKSTAPCCFCRQA